MNRHFIFTHFIISDKLKTILLVAFWIAGICLGTVLSGYNSSVITPDVQAGLLEPQSLQSRLSALLPLVSVFFFLMCGYNVCVYPVLFLWALSLGFTSHYIFCAFGSCAWLLRFFLLFSSGCVTVITLWLTLRHLNCRKPSFNSDALLAGISALIVISLDHSLISPYLQGIIKYL